MIDDEGWPVLDPEDPFDDPPPEPKKKDGRSAKSAKDGRKANSGSFSAGDDRAKNYRQIPPVPVEGTGILRDFRHCLVNPRIRDRTPGEKLARKILDSKPDRFLAELKELEKEDVKSKEVSLSTGPDLGHDAAVRVLDRLLAEATS